MVGVRNEVEKLKITKLDHLQEGHQATKNIDAYREEKRTVPA